MHIEKLVPFVVTVILTTGFTGQLPKLISAIRVAQFKLIQDTKASHWPKTPVSLVKLKK